MPGGAKSKRKVGRLPKAESRKKVGPSVQSTAPDEDGAIREPTNLHMVDPALSSGIQNQVTQHQSLERDLATTTPNTYSEGFVVAEEVTSTPDSVEAEGKRKAALSPGKTDFEILESSQGLFLVVDGKWQPAIWHHDLVTRLDKQVFGVHLYDIAPPRRSGGQPLEDVTTFLPQQKCWGFYSRDRHPEILFQLHPNIDYFANKSRKAPWLQFEVAGTTRMVVDIVSRRPLRDFINIPLQLATNVEGGRLEAMAREDHCITCEDFLQRMIPVLDENGKPQNGSNGRIVSGRPLKKSLENVRIQFRNQYRCISWNNRKHDSEFDVRLMRDLTDKDKDVNTTRNLPELSDAEITAIRSVAKGRRSRPSQASGEEGGEATTMDEPGSLLTEGAEEKHTSGTSGAEGNTNKEAAGGSGHQPSSQDLITPMSQGATGAGLVAKKRRRSRKPANKAQDEHHRISTNVLKIHQPHDVHLLDPRLVAATAEAPCADVQEHLTPISATYAAPGLDQTFSIFGEETPGNMQAMNAAVSKPHNPRHQGLETPAIDHVHTAVCKPEADLSAQTNKRQRVLPPTTTVATGVKFSNAGSPHRQALAFEVVPQYGRPQQTPAQSLRSHPDRQTIGTLHGTNETLQNTTLNACPHPLSAAPPNRIMQHQPNPARTAEEEHARFAFVTTQLSQLSMLKDRLLRDWWANQTPGPLYGRIFTIPLSHLGARSSYRTDVEMRAFMSTNGIPSSFSAACTDLRQHSALNIAVHTAICEGEAWNEHNYRQDVRDYLNLGTEGGFFMALTQPASIATTDSRFSSFTTMTSLTACMHAALWRFKQLTGRDFAPPGRPALHNGSTATYHDAWCAIRRQIFLPYFLRFRDPVEAVAWMPDLGMLAMWTGGADKWRISASYIQDEFGCRDDVHMQGALDPTRFGNQWGCGEQKKGVLPLICVDLEAGQGLA